ncbi:MAG: site-specific integrase [Actinomycetota bacterium]
MKVFLREKKMTKGRRSLYLDFYPPIPHPETRKPTRREHLKLFIYEKPKTDLERDHNKATKILGETLRSRRQIEIQNGYYGFMTAHNSKKSFIAFFDDFIENKRLTTSKSNYENYVSIGKYVKVFAGEKCTFANIDEHFCTGFKDFLLRQDRISGNTASSYFDKFKYIIREAYKQKMLRENPAENIKSIKTIAPKREFLSFDELRALAETPFHYEDLRRACLFASLTGLRYSDIQNLTWNDLQSAGNGKYFIRFRQKKTKENEVMPLSVDAFSLIGERAADSEKIFKDLKYYQTKYIADWIVKVGISRKITFHCFRHTFATLQMTLGTDIYTVKTLLGHKNVQTTQIYAKIIDEKKREAVDKITLG